MPPDPPRRLLPLALASCLPIFCKLSATGKNKYKFQLISHINMKSNISTLNYISFRRFDKLFCIQSGKRRRDFTDKKSFSCYPI